MEQGREASALYAAAVSAQDAADYLTLARLAREIVALCESNGDHLGLAWGHYFTGAANFQRSDGAAARGAYSKAQDLFSEVGNREGVARCMLGQAAVALDIAVDADEARRLYDLAVPIVREIGDQRRLAIVLGNLGEICRMEGECAQALRYAGEAVALFREVGDPAYAGWQLTSMGHYHLLLRDHAAAIQSMRESHRELLRDPIPRWMAWYFDVWLIIVAALDRWEAAARLLGFVNRYRDENNTPRMQGILPWFSAPIEELHKRLSEERLHELMLEGESLTSQAAQSLVESVSA